MTTVGAPVGAVHNAALAAFDSTVRQVRPDQWELPTPGGEWDVRALVEHVRAEACGAAKHLIHAWDLAVAIGADDRLDPELVATVATRFEPGAATCRRAGAIGAPGPAADDDPQRRLLAAFGRRPEECVTAAAVGRFGAAFARRDIDAVMAAMTDDCVFESTAPPDGVRAEGPAAVRAAWVDFFTGSAEATFTTEDQIVSADRVVAQWCYTWPDGHVRGVDVFRVRDRRVAEKFSYVKG